MPSCNCYRPLYFYDNVKCIDGFLGETINVLRSRKTGKLVVCVVDMRGRTQYPSLLQNGEVSWPYPYDTTKRTMEKAEEILRKQSEVVRNGAGTCAAGAHLLDTHLPGKD